MGDEMNVVAKLGEDVAQAGQTLLTESAYANLAARRNVPMEKTAARLSKVEVTCYLVRG